MLAEPRSKRSYTLVPKGKPLYEDETRFGTKLMQKMGWSKGKGLGRDESGSQDFLRVRYKNDIKGLGFEARDDQWTQHEQCFNGLLSTLNGNGKDENDSLSTTKEVISDESENEASPRLGFGFQDTTVREEIKPKVEKVTKLKEKISGISLEEKSKKSRARVHYQKFTRGKDLSQYSEKDLANIFGKKVGEELKNASSQQVEEVNEGNNVQFLHTGVSVSDYFKMKMQAKRNQPEKECNPNPEDTSGCTENNTADENQQKDSKKKKKSKKDKQLDDTENDEKLEEKEIVKKKEKKSKKNKQNNLEIENAIETENQSTNSEVVDDQDYKPKKNKKSKNKTSEHLETQNEQFEKKLKDNVNGVKRKQETLENTIEIVSTDEPQKKKHKKNKKNKDEAISSDTNIETEITTGDQHTQMENKKKKKSKKPSADQEIEASNNPITKSKNDNTKDVSCSNNDVLTIDANSQELKFNQIEKFLTSLNIYTISSFCAEKFRNLNFDYFKGSTLSQIEGYGFDKDIQLEVKLNKNDEERITNLWKGVLDKYSHLEKPKKTYMGYIKEVVKARKMKQKTPKLYVKTWKRKNAFQII